MIEELRKIALQRKDEIFNNANASDFEKKLISDVIIFLKDPDNFNAIPKSAGFCLLNFLGFEDNFKEKYDELMAEVNTKYILVDPEMIK